MTQELEQAIAAFKAGQTSQAQALLAHIVRSDPHNEQAWLWLAQCLDDPERRRYCLERALALNPANEAARQSLAELDRPAAAAESPPLPAQTDEAEPAPMQTIEEQEAGSTAPLPAAELGIAELDTAELDPAALDAPAAEAAVDYEDEAVSPAPAPEADMVELDSRDLEPPSAADAATDEAAAAPGEGAREAPLSEPEFRELEHGELEPSSEEEAEPEAAAPPRDAERPTGRLAGLFGWMKKGPPAQEAVDVRKLLERAVNLIEAGKKAEGRDLLERAVSAEPGNELAWLWLAASADDLGERRACVDKALAINPKSKMGLQLLAGLEQAEALAPAAAPESAGPAPIQPARTPRRRLEQAVALIESGQRDEALTLLRAVVEAEPRNELAWLWLSRAVDEVDEKRACLQRALAINPGNSLTHQLMAELEAAAPGQTSGDAPGASGPTGGQEEAG